MKKPKVSIRILFIIIILLISTVGIYIIANYKKLSNFTHLASGTYAKWMCSCLFVEGRSEEACHNWSRHFVPINKCTIDHEKKTVTVKALGRINSANHVSKELGCTLQ